MILYLPTAFIYANNMRNNQEWEGGEAMLRRCGPLSDGAESKVFHFGYREIAIHLRRISFDIM